MKKIISLLVVLAMLMSMAPAVFATETTEYQEVTILEAIELAEEGSDTKYLVRGTVASVVNTTYGNLYIEDAEGNSLYVYGLYSVDGATRFDAMETQPAVGDTIAVLGTLSTYEGAAQMKNAKLHELNEVVYEIPEVPEYEVVTAPEAGVAYKFGMIQENVSTTDVYYLNGAMNGYYMDTTTAVSSAVDVYLEEAEGGYYLYAMVDGAKKYVNMVVSGTYVNGAFEDAASTIYTFDAESNTVVATVNDALYWFGTRNDKTYTTVGPVKTSYNGFYMQFYAEVVEEPEAPVEGPLEGNILVVGNNKLTSASYTKTEYTFTTPKAGTLYLTIRNYTCNDVEYGEQMLDYAWSELQVDGVTLTAMQTTLEVTEGQVLTVVMTSDGDSYESNLYLSFEGFYQEPVGSAFNPVELAPSDCPTTTIEIPAGGEVYYSLDYEFYEHYLYVYGENAYIAYEGWRDDGTWGDIYVYAENGVVTYNLWEYEIRIGNSGDTPAIFEVDAEMPLGLASNPDTLVIGENETTMTTDLREYYYSWTAETSGALTVTVEGDSYWAFRVQNLNTGEEYYYFENSGDPNTASVIVNAGDQVFVMLRLIELENWDPIDGTLTVTAEFVEGVGEDLSLHLENNFVKVRNNYGPAVTKEYTYVAEQTGTLYITFRSFGSYGYYWEESRLSDEYYLQCVNIFINGVQTTVFQNSVEVNEGDSVVVTIASLDGYPYEANIWLSYEGFYVEPEGSELNPVVVDIEELPTDTIEIPAGEDLYYKFTGEYYDYTLHIYGENAYIVVKQYNYEMGVTEEVYIYAENGVIEYELKNGAEIRIGNAGEAADTFYMEATIPLGIYNNPDTLIIGEQVAPVPADYNGYWYTWTAPEAGTLTITVIGEGWGFDLSNYATSTYIYQYEMEGDPNTASIDVVAGDEIMLNVMIIGPNGWGDYPGGELTVVAAFAPEGGEESGVSGWLHAYVKTDSGYAWVKINAATGEFEALSDYSEVAYTGAGQGNDGMIYAYVDGKYVQIDPNNGYAVTEGGTDAYSVPINDATASAPEQVVTLIDEKSGEAVEVTVGGYLHYVSMDDWNTPYLVKLMDYTEPKTERKYNYDFEDTGMEAIAYLNCELLADNTYFYETYLVVNSNGDLYKLTEKTKVYDTTRGWRRSVELIADLNLDVSNGASMTMLNETTAIIAANNASGVTLYTYDLTAGVLAELYTLAGVSDLVGLENYVVPAVELPLGNWLEIAAGTYTFTAEEDTLLAIAMTEAEWSYTINGVTRTHTDEVPVAATVLKVAAGETVTVVFDNVTYGNINTCAGTAEDPVYLPLIPNAANTAWELNADLPAGEYVYSMDIGSTIFVLTVNGELTEFTADPMGWDPATVVINNTEETNAVFEIELNYPAGTMYNPDELELGYQEGQMIMFDSLSHWYSYTATEDTLLAIELMGENWYYWGVYMNADGSFDFSRMTATYSADAEPLVPMTVIKLAAGETFALCIGTIDGSELVEFNAMTYAGTAEDPVLINFRWNDENTGASIMADLPAGEYVYGQYRISGMALTVNGEAVEYVDGGWFGPCTFTINNETGNNAVYNLELVYPEGHMMNPDMAELGDNLADIMANNYEGYFFNWIAPEDGTLTVTVTSDGGWFFTVQNETQGLYGEDHWCDDDPVVNTETIEVKAGDLIVIVVGTFDPVTYERPAGQVNVNLQFTPKPDVVLGDVNGDGVVDTTDAKLIMQYDLGLIDETALTLEAADVNGDGAVDTTDAKLVMQLDLGLIEEF